jgi:HPt (histidine-containing phosphotransfer) domain-containing protein
MSGLLERCMAAGMDGFLTLPLVIARLHETLERYGFGISTARGGAEAMPAVEAPEAPIHLVRLNELTQGDPEFTCELIATFVASGEQVLHEIQTALAAFDRPGLSRAAHKLKGASANIHAEPLRKLAYALEMQAGSLDQPRLRELIDQLEAEFRRAAQLLRQQAPTVQDRAG